jgi:hypothetical protein
VCLPVMRLACFPRLCLSLPSIRSQVQFNSLPRESSKQYLDTSLSGSLPAPPPDKESQSDNGTKPYRKSDSRPKSTAWYDWHISKSLARKKFYTRDLHCDPGAPEDSRPEPHCLDSLAILHNLAAASLCNVACSLILLL